MPSGVPYMIYLVSTQRRNLIGLPTNSAAMILITGSKHEILDVDEQGRSW